MPAALKDYYNKIFIARLAAALKKTEASFDAKSFEKFIFDKSWNERALKQRVRHISSAMQRFLPGAYKKQIGILEKIAPQFKGLEAFVFPDFVEAFGLDDLETSIRAMGIFTVYSTSEFAVRPFILRYEKQMMKQLLAWAKHENEHLRRLASEGCRPRLPWAMALPAFKKDPSPILPILEMLKNDPSEYVRRSVANNLNDIAKDHPALVIAIAQRWLGKSKNTDWIVKHASRTLLKRADEKALALFGYADKAKAEISALKLSSKKIRLGDDLRFSFSVSHQQKQPQKLRLEYAVYFMKANGRQAKKIFKITENEFAGGKAHAYERKHRFKDFTTRKHYAGEHVIAIIVNGKEKARESLKLTT